jgi:hypothetical protein
MIRNETFQDGVCLHAEVIDLDNNTLSIERYGVIKSVRPLTNNEIQTYTRKPDARESAVAKLQALGLTVEEAQAIVGI